MSDLQCEVCRGTDSVQVCCSGMGAISCAYCIHCLKRGAEPYYVLLGGILCLSANDRKDYENTITTTLLIVGKTRDQFEEDLKNLENKMAYAT